VCYLVVNCSRPDNTQTGTLCSGPKYLPSNTHTHNMYVVMGCVVLPSFTEHCATGFRDMMEYIILY
jgi:hypothetical protein